MPKRMCDMVMLICGDRACRHGKQQTRTSKRIGTPIPLLLLVGFGRAVLLPLQPTANAWLLFAILVLSLPALGMTLRQHFFLNTHGAEVVELIWNRTAQFKQVLFVGVFVEDEVSRLWSLPILCGSKRDTEGVFTKRFEKTKKSVGTEPTTKNHLTDRSPPN